MLSNVFSSRLLLSRAGAALVGFGTLGILLLGAHAHAQSVAPSSPLVPGVDNALLAIALGVVAFLELGGVIFLALKLKNLRQEVERERSLAVQAKQRLENQALFDTLTQLPNRRLFWDRMLQTIKLATRSNAQFGIMMADLDKFKPINDTLGHDAGDIVLKEVAARLLKCVRESDTVARLGGDEFAFICPTIQDKSSASVVCMRIINAMQEPFMILGQPHQLGISLGIALFPSHATDAEVLVRRADTALYRAKEKRNTFVMYDPQVDQAKQQSPT